MHLAVCAHYVLLPSVDIKKLTGQKQNQMHQKPFEDFSTKLSPNWKENPWTVNPIKGCPRSCSSSSCCNFTRVICSPIYCPVPLSEELLQQQQSTGSHSLNPSLPPGRPWADRGWHCQLQGTAGHPWDQGTTTPCPLTCTAWREEGRAETTSKHQSTPVKLIPDLHTLQYTGWHLGIHNAEHQKQNLKLVPSLLKHLLSFTGAFWMLQPLSLRATQCPSFSPSGPKVGH